MTQNTFNFDEDIDRRAVPALKVHPNVLGQDGADLFPGGVADMDFKPPPAVLSAMRDRVAHGVFGYEAVPYGLLPALTGWFQDRHGWTVDPSHILRAPNVLNILAMAARVFTKEGDGVIVQPPVFFDFYDIIAENNRRLVANPLLLRNGRYEMDFAGLARVAADPNVTMLYLCNPHNPVGRVWMPAELLQLGAICRAHGVLVVSDEIHGDVTFPGHHYTPFATLSDEDARNSIICISPAKSFNIAACCAAFSIVIDANRRAMLQAENSRLTVNKNNAFSNVAMEAAYLHGEPWLDAALAYINENLSLVRSRLSKLNEVDMIEPEGTFLLWLDFRKLGLPPEQLTAFLRQGAKWAITRGPAFGDEGVGFGRLNIAGKREHLTDALDRLDRALEEMGRPEDVPNSFDQ